MRLPARSDGVAALLAVAALAAVAGAGLPSAQEVRPRSLFPGAPPAAPAPETMPEEAATGQAEVAARPLAPPNEGAVGLPASEAALGGPLWASGPVPGDLTARLDRLPARVDDPALGRLQRDLLLAPGPLTGGGADALRARAGRLAAMGEVAAAVDLLALAPGEPALVLPRAEAMLAADQVGPACALADEVAGVGDDEGPWTLVRLACAAAAGDRDRVELALSLDAERGASVPPAAAALARAAVGGERVVLKEAVPAEPALLPLLRRAPLDPDRKALAGATGAARQAIARNPNVPAALAPQAPDTPPPAPYAGLDGRPPADWRQAAASVPEALRARWLAALDGLGVAPPAADLAAMPTGARTVAGGRIDLGAWRDLERDREGGGARGAVLLDLLLLLDGRPVDAAPLALRAAVAALRGIGLEADARAVAAAGLAGKGA